MRKIAANYICLPGFPLVKNGYVILEQGRVKDVVDTGGRIREIQGLEVPWEDASRFGLMVADDDDKITEFQEKPKNPKSNLASMGIYIFNWDILKKYLIEDENDPDSENDFGNNIIPNLLRDDRRMYAYHFNGYWKDVGTIPALWEANMEVSTCLMRTGRYTAVTAAIQDISSATAQRLQTL